MQRPSRLETLYDTHAAGVFHYLNGIVKSEADAKDLLQHSEARVIDLELRHMLQPLKRGGYASLVKELEQCEKDISDSRDLLNPHGWQG